MTRPTEFRRIHLRIPAALGEQLNSVAWKNRRSITAEITLALEKHVAEDTKKASGQPESNSNDPLHLRDPGRMTKA